MVNRGIVLVVLVAALAGCAGDVIQKGMSEMLGQPLSAVVSKIGMPNDERVIANQKVYTWYSSSFDEGTQYQCKIRVIMAGDLIGSFDFEGNNGTCMRYAARLRS